MSTLSAPKCFLYTITLFTNVYSASASILYMWIYIAIVFPMIDKCGNWYIVECESEKNFLLLIAHVVFFLLLLLSANFIPFCTRIMIIIIIIQCVLCELFNAQSIYFSRSKWKKLFWKNNNLAEPEKKMNKYRNKTGGEIYIFMNKYIIFSSLFHSICLVLGSMSTAPLDSYNPTQFDTHKYGWLFAAI